MYASTILHRIQLTRSLASAKRVMSLKEPTLKMSKSHEDPRSRILLTDSHEEIHKKVRVALTDSKAGISYDPKTRPGVSNLLDILSHLDDDRASAAEIALDMQGLSLRAFKETVADKVSATLAPIRESYGALMSSARKDELDNVARLGAEAAQMNASTVLSQVKRAVGLE
jgi:tryptophanyl-tRNA synthetase